MAPSERGKNSYHEPTSARSRCTRSTWSTLLVTISRTGQTARAACTADEAGLANAIRQAVGLRRTDVLQRAAQFSRDQMIRSYEEALYDLHAAQSLGRVQ